MRKGNLVGHVQQNSYNKKRKILKSIFFFTFFHIFFYRHTSFPQVKIVLLTIYYAKW